MTKKRFGRLSLFFLAWAVTGLLIYLALPAAGPQGPENADTPPLARVWLRESDAAFSAWLRKRASAYEKEQGVRVYVRQATQEEERALPPDLLIGAPEGETLALRGYALILRDEQAPVLTPLPTSALFFRPSPTPGPSASPAPTLNPEAAAPLLTPLQLQNLPHALASRDPLADFIQGKAPAAILTAAQAARLPFGYQAFLLPNVQGIEAITGLSYSEAGEKLAAFLLSDASQQALAAQGLYSPRLRLYTGEGGVYSLIENSLFQQE